MNLGVIKSFAKINLALNVTGKSSKLHDIESLVAFLDFHDLISIKRIKSKNHRVIFDGKFSKKINSNNTVSQLLKILDKKKIVKSKVLYQNYKKNSPTIWLRWRINECSKYLEFFYKKKDN